MLVLAGIVHVIFASIFFFFQRYIEMGVIITIFGIFLTKIIPPFDILRRPKFLLKQTPEDKSFEQSLYLSSGVLFYTALIGISLGVSDYFQIKVDLRLFHYSVFFLTSVIYGIYLLFYPKNPSVFLLFRTHTMLAGFILSGIVLWNLFFDMFSIEIITVINLLIMTVGMGVVILLDRSISKTTHIATVYTVIFFSACLVVSGVSFFRPDLSVYVFFLTALFALFYIFSPRFLEMTVRKNHTESISWHFSNCILALSWACFFYFNWALFFSSEYSHIVTYFGLTLLFGLWLWVYTSDEKNPVFFSGMFLVTSVLFGYLVFRGEIFLEFWSITLALFFFSGVTLFVSQQFKNRVEEVLLSGGSVLFLCTVDIIMIFGNYTLFQLSMLFFFQSFLWYGSYEIFHRQSHAKNALL